MGSHGKDVGAMDESVEQHGRKHKKTGAMNTSASVGQVGLDLISSHLNLAYTHP